MNRVVFEIKVPARVKKKASYWVSSCPVLDVFSQGSTEEEARKNLEEALRLFLLSCYERNTLEDALKECGFSLAKKPGKSSKKDTSSFITVPFDLRAHGRCAS